MGMWSGGGSKYGYRSGAYRGDFTLTHGVLLGLLFAVPTFGLSLIVFPLCGIPNTVREIQDAKRLYYRGKPYTKAT